MKSVYAIFLLFLWTAVANADVSLDSANQESLKPLRDNLSLFSIARPKLIVWWNIAGRENTELRQDLGLRAIDESLAWLIESDPETLILGEFTSTALAPSTMELLEKHYPTRFFVPYNSATPTFGIKIYSHAQILSSQIKRLGWHPGNAFDESRNPLDPEQIYFERPSILLKMQRADGSKFNLVPVHLMTNFKSLPNESLADRIRNWCNIFITASLPTDIQLENLLASLDSAWIEPTFMIGDFNLPTIDVNGVIFSSPSLKRVQTMFKSLNQQTLPSFPAIRFAQQFAQTPKVNPVLLDYAFSRNTKPTARLIPLAGSDHLPLTIFAP